MTLGTGALGTTPLGGTGGGTDHIGSDSGTVTDLAARTGAMTVTDSAVWSESVTIAGGTVIVSAIAEDEYQRVKVVVASSTSSLTNWTLERIVDGVATVVRGDHVTDWTLFPAFGSSIRTLFDTEAPRGVSITYRVSAIGSVTQTSDLSAAVVLGGSGMQWWVHQMTRPRYQSTTEAKGQPSRTRSISRGVFHTIGRADPVITLGTRRMSEGPLELWAWSDAELDEIEDTVTRAEILVVRAPYGTAWSRRYVSFGDITMTRDVDMPGAPWTLSVPWIEVEPPPIPVETFGATWGDVISTHATWTALGVAHPSWDDLLSWVPQ